MIRYYIGLMSGTSADGVDAVVVAIADRSFDLVSTTRIPYSTDIRERIETLLAPGSGELARYGELDVALGRLFADAANAARAASGLAPSQIRAVGSHGQTLRHHPGGPLPYTIQAGDPSVIAELTGIPVVADFRTRDIAAGGQGAPLVPAFHSWLFRKPGTHRVVVNIGGIANLTDLPENDGQVVIGFDIGPGNTLLDRWIERHLGARFDRDGRWSESGRCCMPLLEAFLEDPYFALAPPKSTGREYFNISWIERRLAAVVERPSAADVQATLADLTARSIALAIRNHPSPATEVYLCGGGARNLDLIRRLERELPGISIGTTAALGIEPEWVEAAAFAWLAHRTIEGRPGNLPAVTGATHPVVLGGIYPQIKDVR